jgi:acyl-[acyl-carrier-protein] desaturase
MLAYDPALIAELESQRPEIPVGLLTRGQKHKALEDGILGLYRWYLARSQATRNWNPDQDFDWRDFRTDHSEALNTVLEGFFAVEQFVPDYASKLTQLTKRSHGRSHFQLRWGSEEEKHANLWYNAVLFARHRTPQWLRDYMENLRGKEWHLPWDDPLHCTVYTVFQERATQINYLNTAVIADGKSDREEFAGDKDPVIAKMARGIAVDEAANYNFLLEAVRLHLYYFPAETLQAIVDVLKHFAMPAGNLIPNYDKFYEVVYRAGIYGPREQAKDVVQVALSQIGIAGRKAFENGVKDTRLVPDENGNLFSSAIFDGITYGKGGAVLKQLGARLGRAGFSAGLRLHFQRHAFSNATLADFLASLEEGSGIPLADWSAQWLRTSGPNRLGAEIVAAANGTIGNLTVTQEVVSGDDVLREHLLRVALLYPGDAHRVRIESHEVIATGARTEVPSATGLPLPIAVIPNHDDLAVGKLALDPATIRFAEERLEEIPDGLLRQLTWMAIWELVRDGRYPAGRYAQLIIDRLPHESDSSIVQGIVESTLGSLLLRYLPDGDRERWGSRIVESARARLAKGGSEGIRIVWSRVMVMASVTPRDVEETWQVAVGETPLEGVEIDQDHRWSLLIRASSFGAPNSAERLAAEVIRDPSDRGARALLTAEAATPSVAAKRATWARILLPDGYGSVRKTLAAASGFAWPWQHELLAPYVAQIPTAYLALGSADATYARDLVTRSASLGLWGNPAAMRSAIDALLKNIADPVHGIPAIDAARLRRFALLERVGLIRVLRQQGTSNG